MVLAAKTVLAVPASSRQQVSVALRTSQWRERPSISIEESLQGRILACRIKGLETLVKVFQVPEGHAQCV